MSRAEPGRPAPTVSYSVIVPAYNEEALLARTLTSVRAAMAAIGERGALVVVDNNSTDKTAAIARDFGAAVVFEPKNSISRAKNAGAAAAPGRFLVFLDADSILDPRVLEQALAHLAGGGCCGGGAVFTLDDPSHRIAAAFVAMFNRVAVERKFAAGCFIYCTRAAFDGVGGFDERLYAGVDISFSRALRRWGQRHGLDFRVIADSRIVTSSRKLRQPVHYVLSMALHVVFPFAVYFRPLCWYWYRRFTPAPSRR